MTARLEVAVRVETPAWRERPGHAGGIVRRAARMAWRVGAGRAPAVPAEVSVLLTDDATIRRLNRIYRGRDAPTNVLAFPDGTAPPSGAPLLLGDVIVAFETVAREADRDGKALEAHLAHLVVHGVLHLLGYVHDRAAEAEEMEGREREAMRRLGFPDPYALAAAE